MDQRKTAWAASSLTHCQFYDCVLNFPNHHEKAENDGVELVFSYMVHVPRFWRSMFILTLESSKGRHLKSFL